MTTHKIGPEVALKLAEAERARIRDWDLQRRGRIAPNSANITDEQVEQSVAILTDLIQHLPDGDRQGIERLISTVRTRLDLKAGLD